MTAVLKPLTFPSNGGNVSRKQYPEKYKFANKSQNICRQQSSSFVDVSIIIKRLYRSSRLVFWMSKVRISVWRPAILKFLVISSERARKHRDSTLIGFLSYTTYYFNDFICSTIKTNPSTFWSPRFMDMVFKNHLILNGNYCVSVTGTHFFLLFRKMSWLFRESYETLQYNVLEKCPTRWYT